MIRHAVMACLVAGLVLTMGRAEDKKGPIEGKWKFTKVESNSTDTELQNGFLLTFDRDKSWLNDQKERFSYKVDVTAKPALLDVKTPDGKEIEGIWEFKGEVLRICIFPPDSAKGRPTEFHGREGQILLTLDRVKE